MYNPYSLEGKTILITGASSGIGKSTAIECSKMGAKLIITGRDIDRLTDTFNNLQNKDDHQMITLELTSAEGIAHLIKSIDIVDGLVNCAGVLKTLPFKFISREFVNDLLDINFVAPALLIKELVSKNKIAKGGSIVFISSISGNQCSYYGNSIYSSSKGAIDALAKNMALELATKKIRVNTINPGMVETNMHIQNTITSAQLQKDVELYPLKRYGTPEDIAHAAIYLLSSASSWVTGTNLLIDGGFTLQ